MSKPSEVISIALAEVGYKEKASNSNLDDKTANAGSGNWTKYARDLANAGYYQANKNGYAWCDVFVDWCFFKAYGAVEGQRIQCQSGPYGAGCIYSAQYYQAQGCYDKTPKLGDQIFFQQGGQMVHTGIVVGVTDSTVTTIEGNSGDMVAQHQYARSNTYIAGYGHPRYDDTASTATPPTPVEEAEPAGQDTLPTLRKGAADNMYIAAMQWCLLHHGYSVGRFGIDADFGNDTLAAVKRFQTASGLEADGVCGPKTWEKLKVA